MDTAKLFFVIFVCGLISFVNAAGDEDYFWRPWTSGSPPSDAVCGRDYRGISYVVQAYAPNYGEFVGQAFANQNEVNVSAVHVNSSVIVQTTKNLKVLCSHKQLAWYPTNNKVLKNEIDTGTIHPVLGGDNPEGHLYIGRYVDTTQRFVFFGSVCNEFNVHYHSAGKSVLSNNFEILVVNDKCTNS